MLLFSGHCELETGLFLHMSQTQASLFAPIRRACEERATLSVLPPSHHTLRSLLYCCIYSGTYGQGNGILPCMTQMTLFFFALCGDRLSPQY